MPKRNIIATLMLTAALAAAPAFADGKPRKPGPAGPAPLKAQVVPVCETGTGYFDKDGRFVCPTVVTRTYTPAPAPAPVQISAPAYDFSGFSGGVGANLGSGFYGGGGGFILEGGGSSSRVLSHPAAAFTFNKRVQRTPTPSPRPQPRPPCGC